MSTTPTTYAGDLYKILFTHLCEHLEDWDQYLILADWYEENDLLPESRALRWCAGNRKRPWRMRSSQEHHWYTESDCEGRVDPSSDLPPCVFQHLMGGREEPEHDEGGPPMRRYGTARDAVLDLLEAFRKGANP